MLVSVLSEQPDDSWRRWVGIPGGQGGASSRRGHQQITVREAMPWDLLKLLNQKFKNMGRRCRPGKEWQENRGERREK